MNIRSLRLLSAIVLAIALPPGMASAGASALQAPPRIHALVVKDKPTSARDRQPAARPARAERKAIAGSRSSRVETGKNGRRQQARLVALEDRARLQEQAQVEGRARRIYAVSQVSAPILLDTSACKRIGAHGESIYENCALGAANVPLR